MRKRRRRVRFVRRFLLAVLSLGLLFAASEWFLDWSGLMPVPLYNQHVRWYEIEDVDTKKLTLDDPQPFLTNDKGLWVGNPALTGVNAEGFRSPEFSLPDSGQDSVLIVGDQMAYGALAEPITACFADRLRATGYQVHNLGVPDTGTRQYAKLVERYLPQLRPKAVVVTFYTGNDYTSFPDLKPGQPLMYFTNVGPIEALDDDGAPITMEDSYRGRQMLFGSGPLSTMAKLILSTRTFSFLLSAFTSGSHTYEETTNDAISDLRRIRDACAENAAQFMLLVVPVTPLYFTEINNPEHARDVLKEFDPQIPAGLGAEHYAPPPTAYLNNRGHALYFDFLKQWLQTHGLSPRPRNASNSSRSSRALGSAEATQGVPAFYTEPSPSERMPPLAFRLAVVSGAGPLYGPDRSYK